MALTGGTRLGQYEILARIGAGGMGEVYRARDTKLGRQVAIKVLPVEFSQDEERVARFEREAKLLASLNHANIATLYGLEESNGQQFVAMELVEGETLAERIARGPIPIDEALSLFEQIAEGLEAAHERGVIHRDVKPANIKITHDERVKILDFGLAKAFQDETRGVADSSKSPTLTKGTALGAILGTASYMSPEQARGRGVDRRADIWAFGCCLYEALTGRRAFAGETLSDTLANVLKVEPDLKALPRSTPGNLQLLLRRCLEKDPKQRLRDMGDARLEIRETMSPPVNIPPLTAPGSGASTGDGQKAGLSFRLAGAIALMSAAVAGLGVWALTRHVRQARHPTRLTLELPNFAPSHAAIFGFSLFQVDISRDGRLVVYVAEERGGPQLYLRSMDELSEKPVPNTEKASAASFSPDGQWILFHADGKLKKVALDGSQLLTLCEAPGFAGASWAPDDTIIFARAGGLYRVAARGGEAERVVAPDAGKGESLLGWPELLPGGNDVLVTLLMEGSSVDNPRARIAAVSLESGERRMVADPGSNPRYVPTGHVVFGWAGRLYAVGFDPKKLAPLGAPIPVVQNVRSNPFVGTDFSLSHEGSLLYARAPTLGSPASIAWIDRQGRRETLIEELRIYRFPRLSPDGRHLAVSVGAAGKSDIWIYDLNVHPPRGRRLASEGTNSVPIWTPDGKRVVFASDRDGPRNLYWMPADGSTLNPERMLTSDLPQHPLFWTPDGRELVFYQNNPQTNFDIWAFAAHEDREPRPVERTPFFEGQAALSSNGKWLAFTSDRDGEGYQIYVRPFVASGASIRISRDGGTEPAWSIEGRELYFTNAGKMIAVGIEETESELRYASPRVLFEGFLHGGGPRSYDVGRDGRFLVVIGDKEVAARGELVIVLNWFEELQRLVPARR